MVIVHEYSGLDVKPPRICKPFCTLKFNRLVGSRVTEHAQVLTGHVKTASLILTVGQVGYTADCYVRFDVLPLNPTWIIPSAHIKVRMHIYLLFGGIFAVF